MTNLEFKFKKEWFRQLIIKIYSLRSNKSKKKQ